MRVNIKTLLASESPNLPIAKAIDGGVKEWGLVITQRCREAESAEL